jgi:hypothetical protein
MDLMTNNKPAAAHQQRLSNGLTCDLYASAADIDRSDWAAVVSPHDWSMQPEVLAVQQRTLAGQAQLWFAVVKDGSDTVQACAAFAMFVTDAVQAAPTAVRHAVRYMRAVWPGALNTGLMFCGLPIPDGGNHLRFAAAVDCAAVLETVATVMQRLAKTHGAHFLVIKEFEPEEAVLLEPLKDLGFIAGKLPPMHRLKQSFPDIAAYRAALRRHYRRQFDASSRKFLALGGTMTNLSRPEDVARTFNDALYQLYLNVLKRSEHRLETLPAEFFRELPYALPGRVVLTVASIDQTPVAFAFGIDAPQAYSILYVGVDDRLNAQADLYFNIAYQSMDAAFTRGATEIRLGARSDEFKSRLGSQPSDLCFFARGVSPISRALLAAFSKPLFPKIAPVTPHNVFKAEQPAAEPEPVKHMT